MTYVLPAVIWISALVAALVVVQWLHLAAVLVWSDRQTLGPSYYRRPHEERRRFKRLLTLHGVLLVPILTLVRLATRPRFVERRFVYGGISGPLGACSSESFEGAAAYIPQQADVFVVTQMRSGTTWMQHLVLQVLTRGESDLVATGTALNAVSPWLESIRTISVDDAPVVGKERPSRIIKTHLGVTLCPFDSRAKYIYVARHPASCFASCADFVGKNLCGFAPGWEELAEWFLSDELMWWGNWVSHVGGWQQRAGQADNVLLVRYEDMTADLPAVAQRVAAFLDMRPLSSAELERVVEKCRLEYMRRHADLFEMHPPHLLQAADAFFGKGGLQRYRDVPHGIRERILDWCGGEIAVRRLPLGELYPDLATKSGARLLTEEVPA